ncbi:integrase core domain-containing protein [Caballeronia sp. GAWG2-1]|uniref:integrase core domain-containing protein n=1 Tax=Caballeronia sp. GAWG2-1 TaxID=2921744 RepID=UPI0032ECF7CA
MRDALTGLTGLEYQIDAPVEAGKWRIEYNTERPHSSLGYLAPMQFAQAHEAKELLTSDSNSTSY